MTGLDMLHRLAALPHTGGNFGSRQIKRRVILYLPIHCYENIVVTGLACHESNTVPRVPRQVLTHLQRDQLITRSASSRAS